MAEPSLEIPDPGGRAADDVPPWLSEALAKRGLEPRDGWPPAHHQLTGRDLPWEEDEEDMSIHATQDTVVLELRAGLARRYRDRDDVLVAHELLVYFDGARPSRGSARRVSPDLLVAFGARRLPSRGSFAVWEEGRAPDFVLEILSEATWKRDAGEKVGLYEAMGAREYFLFDPHGRAAPRLQAWAYRDAGLSRRRTRRRLPAVSVSAGMRGVHSEALGLTLCHTDPWPNVDYNHPDSGKVRWFDPAAGRLLETYDESERRRSEEARAAKEEARAAQQEAQAATERAEALAAELAELKARLRG